MSSQETVIKVSGVYKNFILPHERKDSLKSFFTGLLGSNKTKHQNEIQHALKDINFEINKGEFLGIVGRNGSGKSTLLKILAGIYQPTKGSVSVKGKLVPFIELGVGFNPELTGRENVYLNGAMLGFTKKQVDAHYQDIVDFAEIQEFMDQKLKNYSSGMQVRLAFSCATRAKADVLLVDEVLAVGDADFQRKCFEYFRELKRNKKTVVFVTHDMNAVREYCDRAILIEDSKVILAGTPDKIASNYIKLFSGNDDDSTNDNKTSRWGSGEVDIVKVQTGKKTYDSKDKTITVDISVRPKKSELKYYLGFRLNNAFGQSVLGTNTKIIHRGKYLDSEAKKVKTYTFTFPNSLSDGVYNLDVAVLLHTDEVADWHENAGTIKVVKENTGSFLMAPNIEFNEKEVV